MRWLLRAAVVLAFVAAALVFYQLLTRAGVIGDQVVSDRSLFEDVPIDSPFRPAVEEVARQEIMGGVNSQLFLPEGPITRGQFATIVVKAMEWQVASDAKQGFADVESRPGLDTGDYISVVSQRDVMTGLPGDEPLFAPEENVSLEQAVIVAVRAAGDKLDQPIARTASIDARPYSQPLKDALQIAVKNGLLTGTGIDPEVGEFQQDAQRQQVAALLVSLRRTLRL